LAQTPTCFTATKDNSFGPKVDLTVVHIRDRKDCFNSTRAFSCTSFNSKITTDRDNLLIVPEAIVTINSKIQKATKLDVK